MEVTKVSDVKPKRKFKRAIRRLARPDEPPQPNKLWKIFKLFCLPILIICFIYFTLKNRHIFNELKHLSMNQYQLYLHGRPNYCDEHFQFENISIGLRNRVIGQELAIERIEQNLYAHNRFTAIALYGTQGVGKTLTLNLIQQNFQWHLNVQQYVWSLVHSKQSQLKSLLSFMENLTGCGQNGIFVDDIPPDSIAIIEEFHQKLQQTCKEKNFAAFVVYVFNTDDMNEEIRLGNVPSIQYLNLNQDDLVKCLRIESEALNIKLTDSQMDELIKSIDFDRNGCKTVAAKVALFTRKESGDL